METGYYSKKLPKSHDATEGPDGTRKNGITCNEGQQIRDHSRSLYAPYRVAVII